DLIDAASRFRADELVADKPADLKPYGLDKPEARVRLQSGDKDVLSLVIGKYDKDHLRAYAKLANDDLVFLLDVPMTVWLLGEFRTRPVWEPPLDAAGVDTLRIRSGDNSFVLEKVANVWQVAGKPELKVNAAVVSDTLAALAGLRLVRYAVDK